MFSSIRQYFRLLLDLGLITIYEIFYDFELVSIKVPFNLFLICFHYTEFITIIFYSDIIEEKILFLGDCIYSDIFAKKRNLTVQGTLALLEKLEAFGVGNGSHIPESLSNFFNFLQNHPTFLITYHSFYINIFEK